MAAGQLNLIKLCVGADTIDDLTAWQAEVIADRRASGRDARPVHVTRMWPKRTEELLDGGALYWVFKGYVLARQRIVAFEPREGSDGVRRCAIVLDAEIVRTTSQPRRPFQGWRYLSATDAPRDLARGTGTAQLPPELLARLDAMGVL